MCCCGVGVGCVWVPVFIVVVVVVDVVFFNFYFNICDICSNSVAVIVYFSVAVTDAVVV